MKKGRHRRYEEARAMKRGRDVDFDALLGEFNADGEQTAAADDDDPDEPSDDEAERHR